MWCFFGEMDRLMRCVGIPRPMVPVSDRVGPLVGKQKSAGGRLQSSLAPSDRPPLLCFLGLMLRLAATRRYYLRRSGPMFEETPEAICIYRAARCRSSQSRVSAPSAGICFRPQRISPQVLIDSWLVSAPSPKPPSPTAVAALLPPTELGGRRNAPLMRRPRT